MGFHDMLLKMGIRYDSKKARDYASMVMKRIYMVTFKTSVALAKKGHFEGWDYQYPVLVDLDELRKNAKRLSRIRFEKLLFNDNCTNRQYWADCRL